MSRFYGNCNFSYNSIWKRFSFIDFFALETNSPDEASSLSWSLALLARWEGDDFSIQIIEKKLWPFLQRWSSGEGTNNSAAAVIIAIGKFCLTSWNEFTPLTFFFFH